MLRANVKRVGRLESEAGHSLNLASRSNAVRRRSRHGRKRGSCAAAALCRVSLATAAPRVACPELLRSGPAMYSVGRPDAKPELNAASRVSLRWTFVA